MSHVISDSDDDSDAGLQTSPEVLSEVLQNQLVDEQDSSSSEEEHLTLAERLKLKYEKCQSTVPACIGVTGYKGRSAVGADIEAGSGNIVYSQRTVESNLRCDRYAEEFDSQGSVSTNVFGTQESRSSAVSSVSSLPTGNSSQSVYDCSSSQASEASLLTVNSDSQGKHKRRRPEEIAEAKRQAQVMLLFFFCISLCAFFFSHLFISLFHMIQLPRGFSSLQLRCSNKLLQLRKEKREASRNEKKQLQEKEKSLRKAESDLRKSMKPGECMKVKLNFRHLFCKL